MQNSIPEAPPPPPFTSKTPIIESTQCDTNAGTIYKPTIVKKGQQPIWLRNSRLIYDLFEMEIFGKPLQIIQKPELHVTVAGHTGGTVFDGAVVFAKYLEK